VGGHGRRGRRAVAVAVAVAVVAVVALDRRTTGQSRGQAVRWSGYPVGRLNS